MTRKHLVSLVLASSLLMACTIASAQASQATECPPVEPGPETADESHAEEIGGAIAEISEGSGPDQVDPDEQQKRLEQANPAAPELPVGGEAIEPPAPGSETNAEAEPPSVGMFERANPGAPDLGDGKAPKISALARVLERIRLILAGTVSPDPCP